MALEGSINDEKDYYEEVGGMKVVVEQDLLKKFKSFHIDYVDRWLFKGFKITASYGGSSC
ncbi:hypothetical protein [Inediibacterium massiliense]|uniref:hypothetical protein n=1 Tax=Inediibacterium massiliense TaxID=1658111 RepID=UPI0006B53508|nr:hypothetical protein [Inediibacterium massiliense]